LNEIAHHPTLGLIVSSHPDMKHAVELVEFQVGTSTHRHIRSWKQQLRGTIITTINDEPITNEEDIKAVIQRAHSNKQTAIKIKFGLLVGFAMSGEGVPTLQSDQLNVIAHHLNSFQAIVPYMGQEKGSFLRGVSFSKWDLKSSIETQYVSVQKHVSSY
jgi:hypothetical protein